MTDVLLDTHALIWLANGEWMEPAALEAISRAQDRRGIFVSPISAWEAGLAARKWTKRPNLKGLSAAEWFEEIVALPGVRLVAPNRRIALEAAEVPRFYGGKDPADCFLIATARVKRVPIVTRDAAMLALSEVDPKYLKTIAC